MGQSSVGSLKTMPSIPLIGAIHDGHDKGRLIRSMNGNLSLIFCRFPAVLLGSFFVVGLARQLGIIRVLDKGFRKSLRQCGAMEIVFLMSPKVNDQRIGISLNFL